MKENVYHFALPDKMEAKSFMENKSFKERKNSDRTVSGNIFLCRVLGPFKGICKEQRSTTKFAGLCTYGNSGGHLFQHLVE